MAVMNYCGIPQCKICTFKLFDQGTTISGNVTGKEYTINVSASCKTSWCIYLIGCRKCQMKYVGMTKVQINRRLAEHRSHIRCGSESFVMLNHFTKHHGIADMTIKVIELCTRDNICKKEFFWINELNTTFPYGLNDRVDVGGIRDSYIHMKANNRKPIYSTFNKVPTKRGKKAGNNNKHVDFDASIFIEDLFTLDTNNFVWLCKKMILGLKLPEVKELLIYVTSSINNKVMKESKYTQYPFYIIKDICLYRYHNSSMQKDTDQFMVVDYVNGLVDKIDFKSMLNKHSRLFPGSPAYNMPGISYRYMNSIRSQIVNYKNPDKDVECHCSEYPQEYVDANHHHIMTGDLNIIDNQELRLLISKGLNFRENQKPDKMKTLQAYQGAIDKYIDKMNSHLSLPKTAFTPWKIELLKSIEGKLDKMHLYNYNNVLSKKANRDFLLKLQEDFVFTPVDKAANNVSIVCKRFYYDVLSEEVNNSGNFEYLNTNKEDLIDKVNTYINGNKLNRFIKVNNKLPFLYWSSKMHKMPPNFRYITSGRDTVLSSLSEKIGLCLQTLLKCDKANSKFLHKYHDYNDFFVVDNRDPIIDYMNYANGCNNRNKSVKTYDFTSLYTKIPHRKLKRNLKTFIEKVFNAKKKSYINISKNRAYFATKFSNQVISLKCEELIKHINFIIDNSYIHFDGKCYRQKIGIPMGTSCAPHVANIFLHVYEYEFIDDLVISGNMDTARKLKNMFRYQDDLIVFEDKQVDGNYAFSDSIQYIYPREMELKSTNISLNTCTYLDLRISIYQGKYNFKSYDKRNDFDFEVINYPYKNSNIPTNPAYGIFTSQLVRQCRINKNAVYFKKEVGKLCKKFIRQGFDFAVLKDRYMSFCRNYISEWGRYGVDISANAFTKNIFE